MQIEQGTGLMLHKCALALIAAILAATPALAIETQSPTASPKMSRNQAPSACAKQYTKNKAGPQTAGTLRPPAKIPSTTGAKANAATVAKKPNQHAAAQPATKSKVAKSKTPNSKLGASNLRNSNHAMPANSKQEKSSEARSRPAENRTPADTTGSVPARSVPTPGLY